MATKYDYVGISPEKMEIATAAAAISFLNKYAKTYADNIQKEVPVFTDELRKSVKIKEAEKIGENSFRASIMINAPYAAAVWKGIPDSENRRVFPKNKKMLHFQRWDNGPDSLRGRDGYFHFKSVRRRMKANKFIERARETTKTQIPESKFISELIRIFSKK